MTPEHTVIFLLVFLAAAFTLLVVAIATEKCR